MEQQWAHSRCSTDSTHTFDAEESAPPSLSSPKVSKLFSRKPAMDLCRKFRQGKSRLDCSGQFAGFYSPTHTTPVSTELIKQPEVQLFLLQSPKVQNRELTKKAIRATPGSGVNRPLRDPLRDISISKFEPLGDSKCTPRESLRNQPSRKNLKENLNSPNEAIRTDKSPSAHQKELALLKTQNNALRERNNILENENRRFFELKTQLEQTCKSTQLALAESAKKCADLQRQNDCYRIELRALKDDLDNTEKTIQYMREALARSQQELEQCNQALSEARRVSSENAAELEFVHNEASNQRKMHNESLKYVELELAVLRRQRHQTEVTEKGQDELRRMIDANRKLRASIIELREKLNSQECNCKDELFTLSPESSPRKSR